MITFDDLSDSEQRQALDILTSVVRGACLWRSCADKARDIREECDEQEAGSLVRQALENEIGLGLT